MVCREFKVLPSDPMIQNLEPRQLDWVEANLQRDAKLINDATDRGLGSKNFGGG